MQMKADFAYTLTGFISVLSHFDPSNGSKLPIVLKVEMKSLMVQKGNSNRNLSSRKLFGARKIPFVIGCLFSIVAMLLLEFCPILKNSNPIFLKILLTDIPKGRHTYFSLSQPQQDCIFPLFKILLLQQQEQKFCGFQKKGQIHHISRTDEHGHLEIRFVFAMTELLDYSATLLSVKKI